VTGSPQPARPASHGLLGPGIVLGVLLGFAGVAFIVTLAVQLPGAGDAGPWAALLLVVVGSVLGYRRARAKGHRDLGIGLLIGVAAGLVTGFGALIAFTAAVLSNFT
jgi:hypothetical protein